MPSLLHILSQHVAITDFPTKRDPPPASLASAAAAAISTVGLDTDGGVLPIVSDGGREAFTPVPPSIDLDMVNEDDAILLTSDNAPQEESHEDILSQWNTLSQRETNYSIQDPSLQQQHSPDAKSREVACHKLFRIVDHYDIDRSIVSVAFSHYDRLLCHGYVEKSERPLALITCLFIGTKINSHCGKIFDANLLTTLSRGAFTAVQIEQMELHICQVFDWTLNPPVASHFIDLATPLLEEGIMSYEHDVDALGNVHVHGGVRHELVQQSKFLCELSVMDTFFSDKNPSSIAHASVLVAMDLIHFPATAIQWFLALPIDRDMEEVIQCAQRLHLVFSEGGNYKPNIDYRDSHDQTATSSLVDGEDKAVVRAVTPVKGDMPSDIKRMRHEILYGVEEEDDALATMSPNKKRRIS